jgi:formamidopyrimidine-DNA glycosylase
MRMPELPEVETISRLLRPGLIGRTVLSAHVRWPRTIAFPSVAAFRRRIAGQQVREVGRRGKFLRIGLADYDLLIHLRMSGNVELRKSHTRSSLHDRLILRLGPPTDRIDPPGTDGGAASVPEPDSNLVFNDTRKFGRVWLTQNMDAITGMLGPEPLGRAFTADWLYREARAHRRRLKPLLLDQSFIAGLGNIYTDEALHRARLHPLRRSDSLTRSQAARLHAAIRETLKEGIRRNGASIDWVYRGGDFQNHFRVYDRAGQPCPVCGTTIERLVVGQRGTHICPHCQRG